MILILPGLNDSGPDHWQSHWERHDARCHRVVQDEWDAPRCADWVVRLDETVAQCESPVVLVAHSSACAMVAHWAASATAVQHAKVRGALLVGPSDPEGAHYPAEPTGFAPMPLHTLPFRSIVVGSTNDPYVSLEQARAYARAWGSRIEVLVGGGHINTASGHGPWPEGHSLLNELMTKGDQHG